MTTGKKVTTIVAIILFIIVGIFVYYRYYFVFGEGVKAGELNYIVKKGYLFKTYEGKLIQTGVRSRQTGTLQSNELNFRFLMRQLHKK